MLLNSSKILANKFFYAIAGLRSQFTINEIDGVLISLVFLRFIDENPNRFSNPDHTNNFSNLKELPYDQLTGNYLTRMFSHLEINNPILQGIFLNINFNPHGNSRAFNDFLFKLIDLIAQLDFEGINFGSFFEGLLENTINSQAKNTSSSLQPTELTTLMLSFIPNKDKVSIYNPFSGYASLGLNLPEDSSYLGQEINGKIWAFSKLRLLVNKIQNKYKVENVNVFDSWTKGTSITSDGFNGLSKNESKFDFIVSTPPFNMKLSDFDGDFNAVKSYFGPNNANSYIIHECFKRLKSIEGKAVLSLSNSFLFSQSISEKKLKEYLVENHFVEMVISLPPGILNYTSIPFNLLILSNSPNKALPTFVDASKCFIEISRINKILDLEKIFSILNSENEFKKQVEISEIIENDFNLIPARYLYKNLSLELEPGSYLAKLEDFLDFLPKNKPEPNTKGKFIKIKDLSDDVLTYTKSFDNIEEVVIPKAGNGNASLLLENTLLLSLRSKTLKPTFFNSNRSKVLYPTNDIAAFTVRNNLIDLDYLILELDKEYVIDQIELSNRGTALPFLTKDALLSIVIKVPAILEQQKTNAKLVKDEIVKAKLKELGLEEQFTQLKKEQIEDLSLKKHNIMQHLNNVQSSIDSLSFFMNTNNGILDAKSIIYPKLGTTVQKRFELLAESLKEAIYFVDNITNEINFQKAECLNAFEIINSCIEKGIQNDPLFEISFFSDEDSFINEEETFAPIIKFSKPDFEELYNNILQNAIVHGFTDPSRKYKFAIELKYDQELGKVVISFLNNGKPFPKGMAERYQIKGEKAGLTANKGIGSWKVYEIAKHFNAEIIVQDLAEEEFPVKIDLLLNIENE
jgi:type I restriction-modification system DNA methylase subunit